jgi:hypothetical protein
MTRIEKKFAELKAEGRKGFIPVTRPWKSLCS